MFPSRKVNLFSINSDFGYSFLFLRLKTPILLAKNFIFKNLGCFWTLRNKCSFMYKRYFLLQPFDLQLKHLTEISIRNRKVGKKKPRLMEIMTDIVKYILHAFLFFGACAYVSIWEQLQMWMSVHVYRYAYTCLIIYRETN